MKTDHFPFCGHCWDFQNAGILTEGLLTASFRIWNSSTGIPSSPLALFIMMLPKVNWTSHSRISSYRCDHTIVVIWVIETFLIQFLHVFLSPLLNIFCFCWVHNFFSFIVPIFAWNVPFISLTFFKRSLVFPILLISSISFHCSLRLSYLLFLLFGTLFSDGFIFPILFCQPHEQYEKAIYRQIFSSLETNDNSLYSKSADLNGNHLKNSFTATSS